MSRMTWIRLAGMFFLADSGYQLYFALSTKHGSVALIYLGALVAVTGITGLVMICLPRQIIRWVRR